MSYLAHLSHSRRLAFDDILKKTAISYTQNREVNKKNCHDLDIKNASQYWSEITWNPQSTEFNLLKMVFLLLRHLAKDDKHRQSCGYSRYRKTWEVKNILRLYLQYTILHTYKLLSTCNGTKLLPIIFPLRAVIKKRYDWYK